MYKKLKKEYSINDVCLVNFSEVNLTDINEIFEMRNNENVRRNMLNQSPILYEDHVIYMNSLRFNDEISNWLVKKENKNIGVISFSQIDCQKDLRTAIIGNYLNPKLLKSGEGVFLNYLTQKLGFAYLEFDILKAIVRSDNRPALRIHELFNRIMVGSEVINDIEYYNIFFNKNTWEESMAKVNMVLKHI